MTINIGIDSCPFERNKQVGEDKFRSMIGCATVTEDLDGFNQAYYNGLQTSLKKNGLTTSRKVLASNEILTLTEGDFIVHEELFKSILPKISKLNIFYALFNSKRIPKIKVYGKKMIGSELCVEEFYNKHLINSFPHICLWKIYSYVYGTKAKVHIDHFQSESTEAWDIISKYPDINCYINGDMTNTLISTSDIICRLIDNRLSENGLFLHSDNISQIFPEFKKDQLFSHWIGNQHLPRITMLHTNKVKLHNYIKRPIFHVYIGKDTDINKKTILNSIPRFLNYVHSKEGCVKFFTDSDVNTMKDGDYLVYLYSNHKKEVELLKSLWENQMNLKVRAIDINDFKEKNSKV